MPRFINDYTAVLLFKRLGVTEQQLSVGLVGLVSDRFYGSFFFTYLNS